MIDPLSAGITAVGGIISSIFGKSSQDDTNKANMELAKYQYEKALEMWNKQNDYNTPSAQRQRMEAAGFNPNLVYGHGSVANTASNAPQYQAPTLQAYTNFPNIGSEVAQMLLSSRKNQAEVRKIEAEADGAEQDARGKKIDADVKERYGLDNGMIDNRKKWYESDLLGYQKQWEEQRSKYREEWVDALFRKDYKEVERLEKEIALCDANIEKSKAAADNYKAQTDYIKGPQTAQAYSNVSLNNAKAVNERVSTAINRIVLKYKDYFSVAQLENLQTATTKAFNEIYNLSQRSALTKQQLETEFYNTMLRFVDAKWIERLKASGVYGDMLRTIGYIFK